MTKCITDGYVREDGDPSFYQDNSGKMPIFNNNNLELLWQYIHRILKWIKYLLL